MKVILFDCFGVLSSPVYVKVFETYITDATERQTWIDKLIDLDTGALTEDELVHQISERASVSEQDVWKELDNAPELNLELFDFIRDELKPKYKLGMLTNIPRSLFDRIVPSELRLLFDITLISSELGIVKPNPKIFQIAIEKSQVPASEILFIDDRDENIEVAQVQGIQGIIYKDFLSFKEELTQYL